MSCKALPPCNDGSGVLRGQARSIVILHRDRYGPSRMQAQSPVVARRASLFSAGVHPARGAGMTSKGMRP